MNAYRTAPAREIRKVSMSRELILHRAARGIVVVVGTSSVSAFVGGLTWIAYLSGGWTGVATLYGSVGAFVVTMLSSIHLMDNGWKGPKA